MSVRGIKYNLDDKDIEEISVKIKNMMEVEYKDELSNIPEHIKTTLCQNFAIQCKNNKMNMDQLLKEAGIKD